MYLNFEKNQENYSNGLQNKRKYAYSALDHLEPPKIYFMIKVVFHENHLGLGVGILEPKIDFS
jgi:hypothetical protein